MTTNKLILVFSSAVALLGGCAPPADDAEVVDTVALNGGKADSLGSRIVQFATPNSRPAIGFEEMEGSVPVDGTVTINDSSSARVVTSRLLLPDPGPSMDIFATTDRVFGYHGEGDGEYGFAVRYRVKGSDSNWTPFTCEGQPDWPRFVRLIQDNYVPNGTGGSTTTIAMMIMTIDGGTIECAKKNLTDQYEFSAFMIRLDNDSWLDFSPGHWNYSSTVVAGL